MKQTAVEWLFQELNVFGFQYNETSVRAPKEIWEKIYKKAKQMEKKQIKEAYKIVDLDIQHEDVGEINSEQYYKETYGKNA